MILFTHTDKLSTAETDYLKEAMKFRHSFNGKWRKDELTPLLFRNKCVNWYNHCRSIKGFIPRHAVLRLKNALTENAQELLNRTRDEDIITINQFLKWFDETFDVTSLRSVLHKQIKNWQIPPTTPALKIVDEFEAKLRLFDQSGVLATDMLRNHTEFTDEQLVHKITRALKVYNQEYWDEFTRQTSNVNDMPSNLNQLKELLRTVHVVVKSRKVLESDPELSVNSGSSSSSFNQRTDPITNIGSVNSIGYGYSNNSNNNGGGFNRNSYNNNGWNNSNTNSNSNNNNNSYWSSEQNNGYFDYSQRGSYQSYRGGARGRSRGGYRGGRSRGSGYRGGQYRGSSRGNGYRGNGYRGGYRGNYRGGFRGRGNSYQTRSNRGGRYNNNNNNNNYLNNRREFEPSGNPQYFKPIPYVTVTCRKCNKWGHRQFYCSFMHKYFGDIVDAYNQLYRGGNNINTVSSIQSIDKKNKRHNNDDDSDSDEENERDSGTYNHKSR